MRLSPRFLVAPLAAMSLLTGCSSAPLGPPPPSRASLEPTKTSWVQPAGVTSSPLLATGVINGLVGGTVQVGPWKVLVPAGAFSGSGTITISIPDPTVAQCDLNISPSALNSFKVPVTLSCTFKSATDAQRSDLYWWDPSAKVWRVVPSTLLGSTRSALLWHFSKYSAGRAGW